MRHARHRSALVGCVVRSATLAISVVALRPGALAHRGQRGARRHAAGLRFLYWLVGVPGAGGGDGGGDHHPFGALASVRPRQAERPARAGAGSVGARLHDRHLHDRGPLGVHRAQHQPAVPRYAIADVRAAHPKRVVGRGRGAQCGVPYGHSRPDNFHRGAGCCCNAARYEQPGAARVTGVLRVHAGVAEDRQVLRRADAVLNGIRAASGGGERTIADAVVHGWTDGDRQPARLRREIGRRLGLCGAGCAGYRRGDRRCGSLQTL